MFRPVLAPLAALLPVALLAAPAAAAATDDVSMGFATVGAGRATSVSLANEGTSEVTVRTVASGGGQLAIAASATGASGAVQFPAYVDGSATSPRAVVAVSNAGTTDALNPGTRSFAFGADVRLDAVSSGTALDNGNNVIQRGLYDGTSQYKIQVDGTTASCRVMGAAGAVQVGLAVPTLTWLRLTCSLDAATGTVTLSAAPINADGTLAATRTISRAGRIGALAYTVGTPLSVGGKLTNAGVLTASSDQFNGRLDNAWFDVG